MEPTPNYRPPESDLGSKPVQKHSLLGKFVISYCASFVVLLAFIVAFIIPMANNLGESATRLDFRNPLISFFVGCSFMAIVGGVTGLLIPSRKKRYFIPFGVFLMLVVVGLIGERLEGG